METQNDKANIIAKLKLDFQSLLVEIDGVSGYSVPNAFRIGLLNDRRHRLGDQMLEFKIIDLQSYLFGNEETNRDVSIAKMTPTKRDGNRTIHHYNSAVRNLTYEIKGYIERIDAFIAKGIE